MADNKPSGDFLDELNEVCADSESLADYLRSANSLPEGFPKEEVTILCAALDGLLGGTTEVAVDTLAYARTRIPTWRKDYLPARNHESAETDPDALPTADRHGPLDRVLKDVLASVSSAIAVHEAGLDSVAPQRVIKEVPLSQAEADGEGLRSLSEKALEADAQLVPLEASASQIEQEDQREKVARSLRDLRTRSKVAAAETGQPHPMLRLLGRASEGLKRSAEIVWDVCCNADEDLGPLAEAWGRYNKAAIEGVLKAVKITAEGIDQTIRGIRSRRAAMKSPPPDDAMRVRWELEAAVAILTGQPIPPARQPHLRALSLTGFPDELLEALKRHGAPLGDIYVDPNADRFERRLKLADIRALSALTGLQTLVLDDTQVSNISALSALTGLQTLDLDHTQVSDISALADLTGLQSLYLNFTQVSDISALADLTGLRTLFLNGTQVSDIRALSALTGLQYLFLTSTEVSDINALSALKGLQSLNLNRTQVSDISALAALTELQKLYLGGNQVSDISALSALTGLQALNLNRTQVSDISALAALTELQTLDLRGSQVSDISALSAVTELQTLDLIGTQVSDWSPVDHVDDVFGRPKDWPRKTRG
ncbi:MAG: leucine-rich repeat domain-containing protein [Pseudomonadota bacterium]